MDREEIPMFVRDFRNKQVLKLNSLEGLYCLQSENFGDDDIVQFFTTRLGGVSKGFYESLNLSFSRGDEQQAVEENYNRVAKALGCKVSDIVATKQTHTTNIRVVTEVDRGKGVVKPCDYDEVDGLITNVPGLALAGFTADCVPICFYDAVTKTVGFAHSGWRGTIGEIGKQLVTKMQEVYGSNPSDIKAVIGPSICQACYEVSEDVAKQFLEAFNHEELYYHELEEYNKYDMGLECNRKVVELGKNPGKYQLDLWLANYIILRKAGILAENIEISDICTCHNKELLFSHRASQGKRGNLGAFIILKNN